MKNSIDLELFARELKNEELEKIISFIAEKHFTKNEKQQFSTNWFLVPENFSFILTSIIGLDSGPEWPVYRVKKIYLTFDWTLQRWKYSLSRYSNLEQ